MLSLQGLCFELPIFRLLCRLHPGFILALGEEVYGPFRPLIALQAVLDVALESVDEVKHG